MVVTRHMAKKKPQAKNIWKGLKFVSALSYSSDIQLLFSCKMVLNRLLKISVLHWNPVVNPTAHCAQQKKRHYHWKKSKKNGEIDPKIYSSNVGKSQKSKTETPAVSTVVLAKMKGWSPWPSKLVSISSGRALVYFFGTDNHGHVPVADVLSFKKLDFIVKLLIAANIKQYRKAVREAELCMGIPIQYSVLNSFWKLKIEIFRWRWTV